MTLLDVLRHRWRRQARSPTRGRSLVGGIILVAAAAYIAVLFVGLGWIYPRAVAEVVSRRDPLRLLNEHLLAGALLLTIGRFFLQRSPGTEMQPYRALPVSRGRLARTAQVTSALSLFNLLPGLTLAALWGSTVRPATSPLGAALWAGGALLAVAVTEFANTLLRVAWARNAALTVGGGAVLAAAGALVPAVVGTGVRGLSAWLFGGLGAGEVGPVVALLLGAGAGAVAAHRALRGHLYDFVGDPAAGTLSWSARWPRLHRWRARRGAASVALLDLKLILRNKRARQTLLAQLPMVGVIATQFFLLPPDPDGPVGPFVVTAYCFLLTGHLSLAYHGLGCAWHGTHFDGLLARARRPHMLVRGQHGSFVALCLGQSALVAPLAVAQPVLLAPMGSVLLYNLGVTAPVLLVGGLWTRRAIRLNEGAMLNYQGSTPTYFVGTGLATAVLMGLPVGLMLGLGRAPALALTAGLGLLGLAAAPMWTRGVGRLLHRRRHAMAAGYRSSASASG